MSLFLVYMMLQFFCLLIGSGDFGYGDHTGHTDRKICKTPQSKCCFISLHKNVLLHVCCVLGLKDPSTCEWTICINLHRRTEKERWESKWEREWEIERKSEWAREREEGRERGFDFDVSIFWLHSWLILSLENCCMK